MDSAPSMKVPGVRVQRFDHIVLTVKDIAASCAFYTKVLGMREITYGNQRKALLFGRQKINLHPMGSAIEPRALRPTSGSADVCFVSDLPLARVIAHLQACGVEIVKGPVETAGALGRMESVYFRDPDGNLLEVSNYKTSRPLQRRP